LAIIRPETVDSIGSESILLGFAGEVRGVVGRLVKKLDLHEFNDLAG
jgi:hypothetical protein